MLDLEGWSLEFGGSYRRPRYLLVPNLANISHYGSVCNNSIQEPQNLILIIEALTLVRVWWLLRLGPLGLWA